ncbi:FAD dependent oxidoreductase [Myxozyma melibiosi]|uniref:FAD dependent oxidoreductase n=1 Tax=Myxozyma melibiosi TaxID=54550 RepID=A0ABR1F588_9ASCO
MATIIVGGGIIGLSSAFYLSQAPDASRPKRIIVVDTSRRLFSCASGRAAGFMSRSWFSRPSASLGELSFVLHAELAEIYGGDEKWGYRPSQAFSVAPRQEPEALTAIEYDALKRERLQKQWEARMELLESRAALKGTGGHTRHQWYQEELDEEQKIFASEPDPPDWLFCDTDNTFQISDEGECAQINPYELCEFLLEVCIRRGVEVLHPYQLCSVRVDKDSGKLSDAVLRDLDSKREITISEVEHVVVAAGAWSPHAFSTAFPDAQFVPAISSLAGYSMVVTSPLSQYVGKEGSLGVFGSDTQGSSSAMSEEGDRSDVTFDDASSIASGSTCSGIHPDGRPNTIDLSPIRNALFVRSSIYSRWSPEIFSRSNGEIYIAGLNEQGYNVGQTTTRRGSMAPPSLQEYREQEAESGTDSESDAEGKKPVQGSEKYKTLEDVAKSLLGPEIKIMRKSVCLRPVTPRGEPIIGKVPPEQVGGAKGVYICSGHGPWGISLCLGSGRVITEMITEGQARSADVSMLAPI